MGEKACRCQPAGHGMYRRCCEACGELYVGHNCKHHDLQVACPGCGVVPFAAEESINADRLLAIYQRRWQLRAAAAMVGAREHGINNPAIRAEVDALLLECPREVK